MLDLTTLGGRVLRIRLALAVPLGGAVSRALFGQLVGTQVPEQRGEPFHETTVKRWEEGAEPGLNVLSAISRVALRYGISYASPQWVAFGIEESFRVAEAPLATYTSAEDYLRELNPPARKAVGKKRPKR